MAPFQLQELDAETTKSLLERGDAVLIDCREPAEHARERIPGVPLIPMSAFDIDRVKSLAGSTKIILHCASGIRSARGAEALHAAGVTNVAHLIGGIQTWRAAGFETTTG